MKRLFHFSIYREYFLFLLPMFFVLHGCTENFPLINLSQALSLLFNYWLAAAILFALSYFLFRNIQKAAFFSFFLLSFQLLFGAVHDFMREHFASLFITKYSFIIPAAIAVFIWIFFFLKRTLISFNKIVRYLNILIIILTAIDCLALAIKSVNQPKKEKTVLGIVKPKEHLPNIYLILADEYAGHRELSEYFHYNNDAFDSTLIKKGFQVLASPRSNYNFTPYSMASLFSMDYITGITTRSYDFNNRKIVFRAINDNRVVRILKSFGYEFVNNSLFDFADISPRRNSSDFYFVGNQIINSQTFTSRIQRDLWFHLVTNFKFKWAENYFLTTLKEDIKNGYANTVNAASKTSPRPRFVYTHFVMPHYPYLYDKNGNALPFEQTSLQQSKELYLGYLQYCNKTCNKLIDDILEKDKSHPIILLMSDHGYTKYDPTLDPSYNFDNMISVINAHPLPHNITNVNLFRFILNNEFGQTIGLLKDSTVYLTGQ